MKPKTITLTLEVAQDAGFVILSKEDFEGYKATSELLSHPENAKTLAKSLAEIGAPVDEITPAMIEAGAAILSSFETFQADESYWAKEIYLAMRRADRRD
jgi:hypothetical protein